MNPFRDDHEAALARAEALEDELAREHAKDGDQADRVAKLETQIAEARDKLARMERDLAAIRPPHHAEQPKSVPRTPVVEQSLDPASLRVPLTVGALVVCGLVVFGVSTSPGHRPARMSQPQQNPIAPPPSVTPPLLPASSIPSAKPSLVADRLLPQGLSLVGFAARVTSIEIAYVQPDGMLDKRYGQIRIKTELPEPPRPPDDPARPTGAPRRDDVGLSISECPNPAWAPEDGWSARNEPCFALFAPPANPPRCTPSEVLARAHNDHAPDGLAVISAEPQDAGWQWTFKINDPDRGVSFEKTYGDCAR